ncbi:MAG TPA: hypothetical protein VIM96_08580 [Pseudomonadales bacterium]|jgi:hypothetical protein
MKNVTVFLLSLFCVALSAHANNDVCKQTDANGVDYYVDCANASDGLVVSEDIEPGPAVDNPPPAIEAIDAGMKDASTNDEDAQE